jgi:hypothetical protein
LVIRQSDSAGARHSLVQKHKRQNLTHAGE